VNVLGSFFAVHHIRLDESAKWFGYRFCFLMTIWLSVQPRDLRGCKKKEALRCYSEETKTGVQKCGGFGGVKHTQRVYN
jgi:hypothetical protein